MARIRNTALGKRTRHLYDEETMGDHYEPPGITFNEQGGTVAQIKQDVVEDVVAKFPHLERVDDSEESTASDGETTDSDSE